MPKHDSGAAGFVLAGGQSRRMGQDKALVTFAGEPLIAHALRILRGAGLDPAIAGARSPLASYAPVIEDSGRDLGPLAGICSAFEKSPARWCVFLPVDLPLIPASLLQALLRHAQLAASAVTLPAINGFAQTFPAVLDRAVLPALYVELQAGRRGCFSAFQAASAALHRSIATLPVEVLAQAGQAAHPAGLPAFRWFLNANTPADLRLAEMLSPHPIA
jgi:molybdopterin-guanine dinucleotide biosynthesis protein A